VGGAVPIGPVEEGFNDPKGGGASNDAVGAGPDITDAGGTDDVVLESHGLGVQKLTKYQHTNEENNSFFPHPLKRIGGSPELTLIIFP